MHKLDYVCFNVMGYGLLRVVLDTRKVGSVLSGEKARFG
jgi:hypothetical protein